MADVDEMSVQRLLQQFEHDIVAVNQRHINDIAGDIGKDDLLRIGTGISISRAKYLKLVLEMAKIEGTHITLKMVEEIKVHRLFYEEAIHSFAALRHALERGYIVIKER